MQNSNKIKFTTIIPSAGGLLLPMIEVFGNLPDKIYSYKEISERDKNCLEYLKKKNINLICEFLDDQEISESYDVIGILAPCAGLSDLVKTHERNEDNNNWILKTLSLALKTKSKIVFGENSANLLSSMGEKVKEEMMEIAKKNNYRILFYKTKAQNYGNPQKRERCFYICFNKDFYNEIPLIENNHYSKKGLIDYVNNESTSDLNKKKPSDNVYYKFMYKKMSDKYPNEVKDHASFIKKMVELKKDRKYIRLQREALKYMDELLEFLKDDKENLDKINRIKKKLEEDKNFWGDKITISHYNVPVMVANSCINLVHPYLDRFINKREAISLMDFPQDYDYVTDKKYFFKNVPLKMSTHIIKNIKNFLNKKYFTFKKDAESEIQIYDPEESPLLESELFSSSSSEGSTESI